jgi:hypothetical protein
VGTLVERSDQAEVFRMNRHRKVWEELVRIAEANSSLPPSYLFEFISDIYGDSQAVAVRRMADRDPQASSLANVIAEAIQSPELISRQTAHGNGRDPRTLAIIDAQFTQLAGTGPHLAPKIPERDLARLLDVSRSVKNYVDRHVAHTDKRSFDPHALPKLSEVHEATRTVSELFRKYATLVYGANHTVLHDVPDGWTEVLRVPWLR